MKKKKKKKKKKKRVSECGPQISSISINLDFVRKGHSLEMKILLKRYLHPHVQSTVIYNDQVMETIQVSVNG